MPPRPFTTGRDPETGRRDVTVIRVALTGGIATGKSFVLGQFARHSIPTIDADQVARQVVRPGQPASKAIRARFGPGVFRPDGELDRAGLATRVFDDARERHALEAIVHPQVRMAIDHWFERVEREARATFGVAAIPLLYETGRETHFDKVVVTYCEPSTQCQRLIARDGLSEADARKRLEAQLPGAEKVKRADFVIRTDGSLEDSAAQVDAVCEVLAAGPD